MGTLYLVATPIGNMEDITLRALRLLREVPLIAAEDTRTARILLKRHGIAGARLTSYNDHNAAAKTAALLRALEDGDRVAHAATPAGTSAARRSIWAFVRRSVIATSRPSAYSG